MGIEQFEKELNLIRSSAIRRFTKEVLDNVDEKFWTAPSSSSGNYHPPEDNVKGGLVNHVKKAVVVGQDYARRALFSQKELDMLISSILLHDTCKNGIEWGERTSCIHGFLAYNWLDQFKLNNRTEKEMIKNAVRYHMFPWCYVVSPQEKDSYSKEDIQDNLREFQRASYPSRIEKAVQEADYFSSRENISFLPDKPIIHQRHDSP